MNQQSWHFDPYDDDEYDPDREEEGPDTGPAFDAELDFNPRFGWSILEHPDANDEVNEYD